MLLKVNPSLEVRDSVPQMLSQEWFSNCIITMCDIPGSWSVPAGREVLGREEGRRRVEGDFPRAVKASIMLGVRVMPEGVVVLDAMPVRASIMACLRSCILWEVELRRVRGRKNVRR